MTFIQTMKEMTVKKFFIGTARNVGIGIGLGMVHFFVGWYIVPSFSGRFMFLLLLPYILSAIINFFIGKGIIRKILNTFTVGTIAHIVEFIIFLILILSGYLTFFW